MKKTRFLMLFLSNIATNQGAHSFSLPIFAQNYECSVFSPQKKNRDFICQLSKSKYNEFYSKNKFFEANDPHLKYSLDFSGDLNESLAVYSEKSFSRLKDPKSNSLLSLMMRPDGKRLMEERLEISTRDLVDFLLYNLFVSNNRCAAYLSNAIRDFLFFIFNDPSSYEETSLAESTRQEEIAKDVAFMMSETPSAMVLDAQQRLFTGCRNNITIAMSAAFHEFADEQKKYIDNINGFDDLYIQKSKYPELPILSVDAQLIDCGSSQSDLKNVCLFNSILAYYMARNVDFSAKSFYSLSSKRGSFVSQILCKIQERFFSLKIHPSILMSFEEYCARTTIFEERIDREAFQAITDEVSRSLATFDAVIKRAGSSGFNPISEREANVLNEITSNREYFSEYRLDDPLSILLTILAFYQKGTIPNHQYPTSAIARMFGINVLISREIGKEGEFKISEQFIHNRYAPYVMIYFSNGHFKLLRSLEAVNSEEYRKLKEKSWINIENASKHILIRPDAFRF